MRLNDSSDVPEARLGILVKSNASSQKNKAAFYFPAEEWVLLAASTKEPVEREFVADSGASVHMVSKKDTNSSELETMRTSRSPTTVMTANGEVQTREAEKNWCLSSNWTYSVDRTPTHNIHLCSTVCSQARNASHALGSSHTDCSVIFVRLKRICHRVSHMSYPLLLSHLPFTSTTSSPSFTLLSTTTKEHAAQSVQYGHLQEHPVHHEHLPVDKQGHQESVKSIPPNSEKWLRKLYNQNYNNDTSHETKRETNYSMNKK